MAETKTIRLSAAGMHCGSCAMLIDMTLGDIPGVHEAKTEYASGITTVTCDPAMVTEDDLVAAVHSVGYVAKLAQ